MSEEAKEGEAEAAPKKSKKMLFIIIGVVLLLAGGGAFMFLGGKKEEKKDEHAEEHKEEEKHFASAKLDTFIVNLSENTTFLKATIFIEYDPALLAPKTGEEGGAAEGGGHGSGGEEKKEGGLPPVFEKRKPMIHDAVIRILSSKKAADVSTAEGKETLKQELIEAINEALGLEEGPVVSIYFTEFIIQ